MTRFNSVVSDKGTKGSKRGPKGSFTLLSLFCPFLPLFIKLARSAPYFSVFTFQFSVKTKHPGLTFPGCFVLGCAAYHKKLLEVSLLRTTMSSVDVDVYGVCSLLEVGAIVVDADRNRLVFVVYLADC